MSTCLPAPHYNRFRASGAFHAPVQRPTSFRVPMRRSDRARCGNESRSFEAFGRTMGTHARRCQKEVTPGVIRYIPWFESASETANWGWSPKRTEVRFDE